ncbi:MAG TPA: MFS transporter [Alphaproteobacteria bacterium]|nr:MFS transporter [Alphaproteobacteria bacterium]
MTAVPSGRLLAHRDFIKLWCARVFSALAFNATTVVVGWRTYELTNSAYALGLVGLFQFLPQLLLTFVVGHVADRFDRRKVLMLCQCAEALTLAVLAAGVWGGWLGVSGMFAAVAVLGAARAFEGPTNGALLPAVVPASLLPQAMAMSMAAMQTAIIVGPSLGGLLYGLNPTVPLAICALCFGVAALSVSLIRTRHKVPPREPATLRSVFAGVSFIRSKPVILGTISLDLFAVLLGGVTSLLPIFAADVLHTGPWGVGLLRAAPAVGALLTSFILSRWTIQRQVGIKMFLAVLVFGLATIAFALSTNLLLSCAALAVLGASDMVSVVIRNSLVLLNTPDDMRGRVNAVNALFIGTSNQLGDFEAGMVAGLIGAVPAALFGGVATMGVVLLWMRLFPQLRRAERFTGANA